jgi:hypothetical protein
LLGQGKTVNGVGDVAEFDRAIEAAEAWSSLKLYYRKRHGEMASRGRIKDW